MRLFDQIRHGGFTDPSTLQGALMYAIIFAFLAWIVGRMLRLAVQRVLLQDKHDRVDRMAFKFLAKLIRYCVYVFASPRNWINWQSTRFAFCPWMQCKRPTAATRACRWTPRRWLICCGCGFFGIIWPIRIGPMGTGLSCQPATVRCLSTVCCI